MKKIAWIVFGITHVLLIIKLVNISLNQYDLYTVAYSGEILSFNMIEHLIGVRGFFIEPIFIIVSIVGLLLRNRIGVLLSLSFPYFIIANFLINFTSIKLYFGTDDLAQLTYALIVLISINYIMTTSVVNINSNLKNYLKINGMGFVIGLLLNALIQVYIWSFIM